MRQEFLAGENQGIDMKTRDTNPQKYIDVSCAMVNIFVQTHGFMYQSTTDAISVLEPIPVSIGCIMNTIFGCDKGCNEPPVGFIPFASRRFSMSLEISNAEILIVIYSNP